MFAHRRNRRASLLWSEARDGYLFILPWILGFIIFTAGPMLASLYISFTRWEIVTPSVWVGGAQYVKLFNDDRFWLSLYNTSYYVFVGVPLHLFFALLAALAVNMNLRGIHFFRTAYYVPSLTPVVANSILWVWIFHPEWGLANAFLEWIGLEGLYWLQDPRLAKPALIVMSFWSIGGQMVILLAGLKGIPMELYEAAAIDGANWWSRFWRVTLPLLTPALFFNLIIAIIGAFQVFTQAYIMTEGGPNYSTLFYLLYLFRAAFENFRMGYASAMAWVLFIIVLTFTALQFMLSDRWVFYEGDVRR
ncbi:MAG: sugar ABC transporter permease [Caldilineaceae bacterium SB0661_bin_32]|uniref:Sugar ABC transporter permease n=1 Tax=Caldilineaceae bacterium SB0661_bin_32 TaxID=2605255 RepID=A0A6B1DB28_9CHLR|nr:sugar ABC transporter permease [Caldilineaceae bacterium SB0661_bin_32]